ncbi:hypothetical protein FCN18_24325 [Prauserella endophytica]|uniref:Uncharacterized protein n=2 Tax=Prauserella endophytica TaxID=1592324 RepID=A0ABY2S0H5_9PSEU|nr:hypothetical protein FCN18_24325 [Prauserella endophytica]
MTPKTYRKKPVEIQAMRWDGTAEGASLIIDWVLANGGTATYLCANVERCAANDHDSPHWVAIETLEGRMCASLGDFVIQGVKGEFYPCKPDVFQKSYELVEEQ